MAIYLLVLVVLISLIFLLVSFFFNRHGRFLAIRAITGVIAISFLAAFSAFQFFAGDLDKNVNPASNWQKMIQFDEPVSKLVFRPQSGLFAVMENKEIKITDGVPFCLPGGKIASSHPDKIEVTTTPRVNLPPPSQTVKQQVTFDIIYPFGADQYGASSFIVDTNGEVWCTERLDVAGLSGGAALGFAAALLFIFSFIVFVGSFIAFSVLTLTGLEIYRWKRKTHIEVKCAVYSGDCRFAAYAIFKRFP